MTCIRRLLLQIVRQELLVHTDLDNDVYRHDDHCRPCFFLSVQHVKENDEGIATEHQDLFKMCIGAKKQPKCIGQNEDEHIMVFFVAKVFCEIIEKSEKEGRGKNVALGRNNIGAAGSPGRAV